MDRDLLEVFAEEVLRGMATAVPRIARHWHYERVIFFVVRENSLKPVAQIEEVLAV